MPLSKLFSASTTNAIFWKSTLVPWFPAAREGLVSVVHLPPTKLMMTMHRTGLQPPLRLPPRRVHWRTLLRSSLHVCHKQGRGFKELMIELPLTHRWRYWSLDEETTPPSTFYKTLQQSCDIVTCIGPNQKNQPNLDLYLFQRYKICHFPIMVSYLCIGQNQKNQPNLVLYLVRRSKIVVSVATLLSKTRSSEVFGRYGIFSISANNNLRQNGLYR